jgi:tetratricopeptide (TPR) repeat protein
MGIQLAHVRTEEAAIVVEITALWITGQQDEALEIARLNLQSLPGWGVGQCGLLYSLAGDSKTALELAELALSLAGGPVVLERVARISALEGRFDEAAERCAEALSLSPDFSGARLLRADCLWELCRIEEAGTEYDYILLSGHELPEYAMNRLRLADMLSN